MAVRILHLDCNAVHYRRMSSKERSSTSVRALHAMQLTMEGGAGGHKQLQGQARTSGRLLQEGEGAL